MAGIAGRGGLRITVTDEGIANTVLFVRDIFKKKPGVVHQVIGSHCIQAPCPEALVDKIDPYVDKHQSG
jgi:hypothetical protein